MVILFLSLMFLPPPACPLVFAFFLRFCPERAPPYLVRYL